MWTMSLETFTIHPRHTMVRSRLAIVCGSKTLVDNWWFQLSRIGAWFSGTESPLLDVSCDMNCYPVVLEFAPATWSPLVSKFQVILIDNWWFQLSTSSAWFSRNQVSISWMSWYSVFESVYPQRKIDSQRDRGLEADPSVSAVGSICYGCASETFDDYFLKF